MPNYGGGKKQSGKFYAVRDGFKKGIFNDWSETSEYVNHYSKAQFKSFKTLAEAENYMSAGSSNPSSNQSNHVQTGYVSVSEPQRKTYKSSNSYNKSSGSSYSSNPQQNVYKSSYTNTSDDDGYSYSSKPQPKTYSSSYTNSTNYSSYDSKPQQGTYSSSYSNNNSNSSFNSKSFNHYQDDIYIENDPHSNNSNFYAVEDASDNKKYIFKNWSEVQNYMSHRKSERNGSSAKAPINYKKIDSVQGCVDYFNCSYPKHEEKLFDRMGMTSISSKKVKDPAVSKLSVYCDGSGANNSMGYGVYFDETESKKDLSEKNSSTFKNIYGTPPVLDKDARSTNNIAELYALKKSLEKIESFYENDKGKDKILDVTVFTDSNYSLNAVQRYAMNKETSSNAGIPNEAYIKSAVKPYLRLKDFYEKNVKGDMFKLKWTAGHTGTAGNEYADKLANMGAFDKDTKEEKEFSDK
ncbi:hypothetical protein HANVADRAFT_55798 [Hanseniaspora valbyensis NRRL Y-1626]|uniref:Ribonuclease H n=1 Tax=Hanseniaspora valbyensis NRRL Y-1626 TaxID=766949 RepID=A0A1B7TF81_9ASCO|nr:hypothetical protein HANVADRAFT_55798 [Hanseniaspora valbyensis NRRL Y-1626]